MMEHEGRTPALLCRPGAEGLNMRKMDWSLAYYTLRADIWREDLLQATFGLGVSGSSP
jgi:hypothetical protein